jgi:ribosomal protein L6P/L9E
MPAVLSNKKYKVKIPVGIKIIYCTKTNVLCIKNLKKFKFFKSILKLKISNNHKYLTVTDKFFINKISNVEKKNYKSIQGLTTSLIKQIIKNTLIKTCKKLNLVGIGYKCFILNYLNHKKILHFRLGYSHNVYFKLLNNIEVECIKNTKLFLFGDSYQNILQLAALIKSYKTPDVYKGKGILYSNENIKLKKGKKI